MICKEIQEKEMLIEEIINEIRTPAEALKFSVRQSGLTDKHIYLELGMDAAYWSRIMSGQYQFPVEKLKHFIRICGNDIFLRWLAKDCGYTLRPINLDEEREKALARVKEIEEMMQEGAPKCTK